MTTGSGTISRSLPSEPGLSFAALYAEGVALVQAMSGQVWTNYNFSDPGVTILQQLCYALTELSFRARFPVEDLLADPATGQVQLRRQALYPIHAIMPCNPVTAADFRRLILDRVRGAANVWMTPCPVSDGQPVNGLYRMQILTLPEECRCDPSGPAPREVRREAVRCYDAHRGLCEDLAEVVLLRRVPVRVTAVIQIAAEADAAATLARVLFRIGLFLAPEPKRHSLAQEQASGRTTSEIFTGPLPLRGFIDDDQLTPLPTAIAMDDLLQEIAETEGVLSAERLTVQVADGTLYTEGQVIPVPADSVLWLNGTAEAVRSDIAIFRGLNRCQPNPARVTRLLDRLWGEQRRTYRVAVEYAAAYPPPTGRQLDLAAYSSVQNQFPDCYGINSYGVPAGAGLLRQAQALQLKGYLMVFDQLMADYFSQLAYVRELFTVAAGGEATYAWQPLRGIVPAAELVLKPGYDEGMAELVAGSDPVLPRQNGILEFLLSLYAEQLEAPDSGRNCCTVQSPDDADAALRQARRAMLVRVPPAGRDRGRGFDYRRQPSPRNAAGLEIRCRIQLALLEAEESAAPVLVQDPDEAGFGWRLPPELADRVVHGFSPVGRRDDGDERFDGAAGDDDWDLAEPPSLSGQKVAARLFPALADTANYRVGRLNAGSGWVALVCLDLDGNWWLIGTYADISAASAVAAGLAAAAGDGGERLTLVEWTLLRHAAAVADQDADSQSTDYSFRVTAVCRVPQGRESDAGWRSDTVAILRGNVPAHVVLDVRFFRGHRLRRFRRLYAAWTEALRTAPPGGSGGGRLARASWRLQRFLEPDPPPDGDDGAEE